MSETNDIARLIERYLLSHPNSEDNLDGIANWWIQRQLIDDSKLAVQTGVEQLVQRGVITRVVRNNDVYYRLVR